MLAITWHRLLECLWNLCVAILARFTVQFSSWNYALSINRFSQKCKRQIIPVNIKFECCWAEQMAYQLRKWDPIQSTWNIPRISQTHLLFFPQFKHSHHEKLHSAWELLSLAWLLQKQKRDSSDQMTPFHSPTVPFLLNVSHCRFAFLRELCSMSYFRNTLHHISILWCFLNKDYAKIGICDLALMFISAISALMQFDLDVTTFGNPITEY